MIFLGIDNGVSGSCGVIPGSDIGRSKLGASASYIHMPVKKVLSYTKKKQWLHRVDVDKLTAYLQNIRQTVDSTMVAMLERPMVNPGRFKASESALRAFEATLITLEGLSIPYEYIDSKEWQRALLPKGLEKDELKAASLEVGKRLYPGISFDGFSDADGLLISEYRRRKDAAQLCAEHDAKVSK